MDPAAVRPKRGNMAILCCHLGSSYLTSLAPRRSFPLFEDPALKLNCRPNMATLSWIPVDPFYAKNATKLPGISTVACICSLHPKIDKKKYARGFVMYCENISRFSFSRSCISQYVHTHRRLKALTMIRIKHCPTFSSEGTYSSSLF